MPEQNLPLNGVAMSLHKTDPNKIGRDFGASTSGGWSAQSLIDQLTKAGIPNKPITHELPGIGQCLSGVEIEGADNIQHFKELGGVTYGNDALKGITFKSKPIAGVTLSVADSEPARKALDELGVRYETVEGNLVIKDQEHVKCGALSNGRFNGSETYLPQQQGL